MANNRKLSSAYRTSRLSTEEEKTLFLGGAKTAKGVLPVGEFSVEGEFSRKGDSGGVFRELQWCDRCANWRTVLDDRTGWCRVCGLRDRSEKYEVSCFEALLAMNPEDRDLYAETETQRQSRKISPKPKRCQFAMGADTALESEEEIDAAYFTALEEWECERLNRLCNATKTRLRRMREKTGSNPRKGRVDMG